MKVLLRDIEERLNLKLNKIRLRKGHIYFLTHPEYPKIQQKIDSSKINNHVKKIKRILPKIKKLLYAYRKKTIPLIWGQTKYSASYLLICKSFITLKTSLFLAKAGSNFELVELCRSAVESLDLAYLFIDDDEEILLKKWFRGEIIKNSKVRSKLHQIINRDLPKTKTQEIPFKDAKRDIYGIYSLYSHSAYSSLLDSVDIFNEDYDFKNYAGFHYVYENLHLIDNIVVNILLNLKNIFIKLNDLKSLNVIEEVFNEIGFGNMSTDSIDKTFSQYYQTK